MADTDGGLLSDVEKKLKEKFEKGETTVARVPSTARWRAARSTSSAGPRRGRCANSSKATQSQ